MGAIYSAEMYGGQNNEGTIYELASGSHTITMLASFGDPHSPMPNDLYLDANGNLFGTTRFGGANKVGSIFELASGASSISTLYSFQVGGDGFSPQGNLLMDSGGHLIGTTYSGGAQNDGTIFEYTPGASLVVTLASFNSTNGSSPLGQIVMDASGNIFGAAAQGARRTSARVFELPAGSQTINVLYSFPGINTSGGAYPTNGVTLDRNGAIYGTAQYARGGGDLAFSVNRTPGTFVGIYQFMNSDGHLSGITTDDFGNIYGMTSSGGGSGSGYVFDDPGVNIGSFPSQSSGVAGHLIMDGGGNLFGVTGFGGTNSMGTIFEVTRRRLVFVQQPVDVIAGNAIAPAVSVQIQNELGQVVSSDNSQVTIAKYSGPDAILSGTAAVAAQGGIATFADLSYTTAGIIHSA